MKTKSLLMLLFALLIVPLAASVAQAATFSITSSPSTSGQVGIQYSYQVQVNNPDNETLTYSLTENPSGMDINSTGFVDWIPTSDGTFPVTIQVTNSTHQVNQSFSITVVSIPPAISASVLELGGTGQERDQTINFNYEIENTGSQDIQNLQVEFVNVHSRYSAQVTAPSSIPANSQVTGAVSLFVPENQPSGRQRLGQIRMTADNANTVTRDVFLTTESYLEIEYIDVRVDGRRDRMTSPGLVDRRAEIGSNIDITVRVRNTAANTDLEDLYVELFSADLLSADGLEQRTTRLRSDRTTDFTFRFEVDAEDIDFDLDIFDIEVRVTADDENNARHSETWDLEIELDRPNRDVRITSSSVSPGTVSCSGTFVVSAQITNTGLRDLSAATVWVEIPSLGIQEFRRNIRIDEFDRSSVSFSLRVPSDASNGQHVIELYANPTLSASDFSDSRLIDLFVTGCGEEDEEDEEEEDTNGIDIVPGDIHTQPIVVGQPITDDRNNEFLLTALLVGVLVMFVLVVVMFWKVAKN